MDTTIRQLSNAEMLLVETLEQELFIGSSYKYRNLVLMVNNDNYLMCGLWVGQVLVGYFIILITVDDLEIIRIGVRPRFQHCGYGAMMLQQIVQIAVDNQKQHIFLEVRKDNYAAISLYQKGQFAIVGEKKRYYGNVDGWLMRWDSEQED